MKIHLRITAAGVTRHFEHSGPVVHIGRNPDCELSLQDAFSDNVSRQHARIELRPGGAIVIDEGSSNDTLLNNQPIRGLGPRLLRAGDTLRMGYTGALLEVTHLDVRAEANPGVTRLEMRVPGQAPPLPVTLDMPSPRRSLGTLPLAIAVGIVLFLFVSGLGYWLAMRFAGPEPVAKSKDPDPILPVTPDPDIKKKQDVPFEKLTKIPEPVKDPDTPKQPTKVQDPVKLNLEEKQVGRYRHTGNWPGILLQRRSEADPWMALRSGEGVYASNQLIALPGCECPVVLDTGVQVTLFGNLAELDPTSPAREAVAVLSVPPSGFDVDLVLDRGRALIANPLKERAVRVLLRFHRELWTLSLPAESAAVLELVHDPSTGKPPAPLVLFLHAVGKPLQVQSSGRSPLTLEDSHVLTWASDSGGLDPPEKLDSSPPWIKSRKVGNGNRTAAALVLNLQDWHRLFHESISGDERKDVRDTLQTRLNESQEADDRLLAVYFLAALDDPAYLVALLDRPSESREMRLAVANRLADWLLRTGRPAILRRIFREYSGYSEENAERAIRLLDPAVPVDDPLTSCKELVPLLNHGRLCIRSLTEFRLYNLYAIRLKDAKQTPAYSATAEPAVREKAIQQWERILQQPDPFRPAPKQIPGG